MMPLQAPQHTKHDSRRYQARKGLGVTRRVQKHYNRATHPNYTTRAERERPGCAANIKLRCRAHPEIVAMQAACSASAWDGREDFIDRLDSRPAR